MNDLPKKKFIKRKNQIEENYKIKEKKMKKRTYRINISVLCSKEISRRINIKTIPQII